MNIIQVSVNRYALENPNQDATLMATLPVAIPDLADVRAFAMQLHARKQEFKDVVWGWSVQYDPEIREESAEFQIPLDDGSYRVESRPFWSPASFTIGESGIWFFSLLWENGEGQSPIEFLEQPPIANNLQFEPDNSLQM